MKNQIEKFFLKEIFKYFNKNKTIVILYGSFDMKNKGDFDVAVITENYSNENKEDIENILKELHQKFELRIDEEVPYFNKSLFSYNDIENCMQSVPFKMERGVVKITPFGDTGEYFRSEEARKRLLLNILTTKSKVINGKNTYQQSAYSLMIKLVFSSKNYKKLSLKEIIETFFIEPNTFFTYKQYLGYNPLSDLNYLKKRILKTLKMLKKQGYIEKQGKLYVSRNGLKEEINLLTFLNN